MTEAFFERPILNSPYEVPRLHHALDKDGQPLDLPPVEGRRRSELITPVPKPQTADRLLPRVVRDVDGLEEPRFGTVSVFNGPDPVIMVHADAKAEIQAISQWIGQAVAEGTGPSEIGIFVRTEDQLHRARAAARAAGHDMLHLSERSEDPAGRVSIGIMHLAKGLEFKAVMVMACDDEVLPLQSRIESVADEVELDDVYETELQLLYVAGTRARDRLMISGVNSASEFLKDLDVGSRNSG
jgi:superfamily I DNA/RNA helicase